MNSGGEKTSTSQCGGPHRNRTNKRTAVSGLPRPDMVGCSILRPERGIVETHLRDPDFLGVLTFNDPGG